MSTQPPEDLEVIYELTDEDLAEDPQPKRQIGRTLARWFLALVLLFFLGAGALSWLKQVREGKATLNPNASTTQSSK